MNEHVEKAREYVERGDEFYAKAAQEIIAAQKDGVKMGVIAAGIGRSDRWCRLLVASWKSRKPDAEFKVDWERGTHGTKAEIEKGVEKALADPKRVEQIVKDHPAAVSKALAEDDDFAFDAMTDPQARLNTAAAGYKHRQAVRSQVDSEEKARNKDLMSEKEYDGLLLLQLGQAGGEIVQAARNFGRTWSKNVGDLSDEGRELALDLLARQQVEIMQILDAARGADVEEELARLLAS